MRGKVKPQAVYTLLWREATANEGAFQQALDLTHKIKKHGNTIIRSESSERMNRYKDYVVIFLLHFISDRTGWSNLYRWRDGKTEALTDMKTELARPQWQFGFSNYAFVCSDRIVCTFTQDGIWKLAGLDTSGRGSIR